MSTPTSVQIVPGNLVLSGNVDTNDTDNTFCIDRANGIVGIGQSLTSLVTGINDSNVLQISGEVTATKFHGDGTGITGLTDSKWLEDDNNVNNIHYSLGNVGIGGVASGTEALTVYGDLNIKNSGQLKFDGADAVFSKWSSDTNGIYRPSNVGIGGVPSATNKLKVHGTVEASGFAGGGVSTTNTGNTVVKRDASGNFTAGTITASGFAGTAIFGNRPIAVVGRNNLPSEGQRNTYPHPSGIFVFNHTLINSGIYNSSNGRFTAPSGYGGYYLLSFTGLSGYYNTNAPNTRWYQNGYEHNYGAYHTNLGVNIASAQHVGISGMHILNLAAGQYVDLRVVGGTLYGQSTLHAYAVCLYLGAA